MNIDQKPRTSRKIEVDLDAFENAYIAADNTQALLHALTLYLDEIHAQVAPSGSSASGCVEDWVSRARAVLGCAIDYAHETGKHLGSPMAA